MAHSVDPRVFELRVAGPAALLVAKVHKIDDRHGSQRETDKDALDVLRLLRGTTTDDLAGRFVKILADSRSAGVAARGKALLAVQFATRMGVGVEMAVRAAGPLADADEIAASAEALAGDLLAALR